MRALRRANSNIDQITPSLMRLVFGVAALQGGRETINQTLVVEGLVQEANRSGLQHLRPDALFWMCRNADDRHVAAFGDQAAL